MTDLNVRQQIADGNTADAILQHPLIQQALEAYEQELTQQWQQSAPQDAQLREELHRRLKAATAFKQHLLRTIQAGQLLRDRVSRGPMLDRTLRAIGAR